MPRARAILVALLLLCGGGLVWLVARLAAPSDGPGDAQPMEQPPDGAARAPDSPSVPPPAEIRRRVHGRVSETGTGEGLADFRLRLVSGSRTLSEVRSAADGTFDFPPRSERGTRLVVAAPEGYALAAAGVDLNAAQREGDEPIGVVARRERPLYVGGILMDAATGEPVPHFQLKVARSGRAPELVTSDREGRFRASTPGPLGAVRAELVDVPGLARSRRRSMIELSTLALDPDVPLGELSLVEVPIQVGPTFLLDIAGTPPASMRAVLEPDWPIRERDLRREGLSPDWNRAPVRYEGDPGAEAVHPWTRFASAGPAPPAGGAAWTLSVRDHDGWWTASTSVPVRRGVHQVRLEPARTGRVEGRVTDGAGRPLAGVALRLGAGAGGFLEGTTDADGTFDIGWVPPGLHALRASDPRGTSVTVELEVAAGEALERVLVLDAPLTAGHVRGRLSSRTGRNRNPGTLRLRGLETEPGAARLLTAPVAWQKGAEGWVGTFAFEDVPPGAYELTLAASPYGHAWSPGLRRVRPPTDGADFVLRDEGALTRLGFRVQSAATGAPVPRFSLVSHPPLDGDAEGSGWFGHGSARSDATAVTVAAGRPFDWFLVADGYRPATGDRTAFAPVSGDPLPLSGPGSTHPEELAGVRLVPGWGACVFVVGADGEACGGVEVLLDGDPVGRTGAGGWLHLARDAAPGGIVLNRTDLLLADGNVRPDGTYSVHNGCLWVSMRPR